MALLPLAAGALAIPATSATAHAAAPTTTPVSSVSSTAVPGLTTTETSRKTTASEPTAAERRAAARREARRVQRHKRANKVWDAFKVGTHQEGDPYRYGATGPGSFDCSGLTSYAYKKAGFALPRTSSAQAGAVRHIARKNLRKGDLVFFTDGGGVYHVGLFAGRRHGSNYVLHAPYSGSHVKIEKIWTNSWFGGTKR
jgi:cell wall-associated NlpC family hydrolase